MLEANRIILDTFVASGLESVDGESRVEGKVVIEPGAKLSRSTVVGRRSSAPARRSGMRSSGPTPPWGRGA